MAFKLIAFATLVAAASAGLVPAPQHQVYAYAAPVVTKVLAKSYEPEPYDHNPQYSYSYDVHDTLTGDAKSQHETRNGDVVEGSYSLIEADGSRRVVHYTADDHNGFNAVVEKQPGQVAVKVAVAQPIAVKTVAQPIAVKTVAYQAAPASYHVAPATYNVAPAAYHVAPAAYHAAPAYTHATYAAAVPVAHGYAAPALAHSYYH